MTFKNAVTFIVTSVCALLVTTSCSYTDVYHSPGRRVGHGPPAHAPAHGHRRKHVAGMELVFDSGLGLYVVVGHPEHYYCDGHFYRLTGGVWEMSLRFDGGWAHTSGKPLPPGLRAKAKGNSSGKFKSPAKAVVNVGAKDNGNGKSKNQGKAVARGKGKYKGR